ncbi:MAG: DNA repair protein RecO [Bacteroidales bacterium]
MSDSFHVVVLHVVKHKESGYIIQGYSDRNGRESFFLRAPSKKSNLKVLSQFHPLAILELTLSGFRLSEIPVIKEFEPIYKLSSIRGNVVKSSIALFMSELIYRTLTEQEHNPEIFLFIRDSVTELENLSSGIANFHLLFLLEMCKKLGYTPEIKKSIAPGMLFDIPMARFLEDGEYGTLPFGKWESDLLYRLNNISTSGLSELKLTGNQRYEFIGEMIKYLTFHTGHEIRVESLNVLKEVFE